MLRASVFAQLEKPWFNFDYQAEKDRFMGEDWWLCRQLEKAGVDIWIDHDLSKEVAHEGFQIFSTQMTEISKKLREENPDVAGRSGGTCIIQAR